MTLIAATGPGGVVAMVYGTPPSTLTDANGECVFIGHINPTATIGQSSVVTFSSNANSVSGSITVQALAPSNWVTVYRSAATWVQIPRDLL